MTDKETQVVSERDSYASVHDFCSMFKQEMDAFFQLAFTLTGNEKKAEEVIVNALDDCAKAKVFRPWAKSWSRLAVIERAIKTMASNTQSNDTKGRSAELQSILNLAPFDRFVYVLTVLEKYSIRDCAVLLRASKREVLNRQVSALEQVAKELSWRLENMHPDVRLAAC